MQIERRWQGAAVIGSRERKRPHLLLFTLACVDEIEAILEAHGMLAGAVVTVGRVGVDRRSQMFIRKVDWEPYQGHYFTTDDIERYLTQVFQFGKRRQRIDKTIP